MKQFINSLFEEKNRINFQYMDYNMSFYSEKFRSYYLLFYISSTEELVRLWENSGDIFESLKCCDEYHTDMDKNTMCIYCLQTSEEEYYATGQTGTISDLGRKISMVEEDLNYFAKHVFIYTDKMRQFAIQHVGNFGNLCEHYLNKENFEKYKNDIKTNYEYDFIVNLFIKIPFLNFRKYYVNNQKQLQYQSVINFVQQQFNNNKINVNKVQENVQILEKMINNEDEFFKWIDKQTEQDLILNI